MNHNTTLGSVRELWRFPIKSMRGERLECAHVGEKGLIGDRGYALLDVGQDKVVTAKSLKRFPIIFKFRAVFHEEPVTGSPLPPVNVELPGGDFISSTAPDFDEVLSGELGRAVRLVRAGENASIPYHDAAPLSVLTDATLKHLRKLQPKSDFDVRRFRMNIIVGSNGTGFAENAWIGHSLKIGQHLRLKVTRPNARCVMTTLAQDELPADREIFSALVKHNRLEMESDRRYPCAGIYVQVESDGVVGVGDAVST